MEIKSSILQVLQNNLIKAIPARSLFAVLSAATLHPALASIGFDVASASSALVKLGFMLGEEVAARLIPELVAAAKKGIQSLAEWLERAIADRPEVNEAAANLSVEQAKPVAAALQEASPDDRKELASKVGEGMKSYGGATAAIADLYAIALTNPAKMRKLLGEMQEMLGSWSKQTMEARRGSLISGSIQQMEGPGQQIIRAEDNSKIIDSRQEIKTTGLRKNRRAKK